MSIFLRHFSILLFIILFLGNDGYSQFFKESDSLSKNRRSGVVLSLGASYLGGFLALGQAWYKNDLHSNFHFFNDNREWLQMDKAGHIFSAYQESSKGYELLCWAGESDKAAILFGLSYGLIFQTTLEVFDGYSNKWGFSWGDICANSIGLGLFGLQQSLLNNQVVILKFSSHVTKYQKLPIISLDNSENVDYLDRRAEELFGSNLPSRVLKDYNAQTIWASINLASLFRNKPFWMPSCLNIAFGYGGEQMLGGFENSWVHDKKKFIPPNIDRYRQYYFSFDLDLTKIKTESYFLKTLFSVFNVIKIPSPTLEFVPHKGIYWHAFYF